MYVRNEVIGRGNVKFTKMLVRDYKAVCTSGVYRLDTIETVDELNTLIRRMIAAIGETSVYPFITPFEDALMVSLRRMDIGARCFK